MYVTPHTRDVHSHLVDARHSLHHAMQRAYVTACHAPPPLHSLNVLRNPMSLWSHDVTPHLVDVRHTPQPKHSGVLDVRYAQVGVEQTREVYVSMACQQNMA